MKFTCDTASLKEAVAVIGRVVQPHAVTPALEGILLHVFYNHIELSGFGTDIGITTRLAARVEEEGELILPAKMLGEIVRRLPGEMMTLSAEEEKFNTEICSGAAQYTIMGMSSDEFPEFPSSSVGCTSFAVNQKTLASMIGQTLYAISQSETKPVHTGSLFETDGRTLRVVSVDGYRLAMRTETVLSPQSMHFVVPGKALTEVLRILDPECEDAAEILVAERHVFFRISGFEVYSRLLEGEFLNYRAAIPEDCTTHIRVSTRALTESVDRVSLIINDRLRSPLRLRFAPEEIRITCTTALGRATDSLPCRNDGTPLEMGFNNRYLLDALKNTDCDEVVLEIKGPLAPMRIVPPEGEHFLFLVLPVRLKAEDV